MKITVVLAHVSVTGSKQALVVGPADVEHGAGVALKLVHEGTILHIKKVDTPILTPRHNTCSLGQRGGGGDSSVKLFFCTSQEKGSVNVMWYL